MATTLKLLKQTSLTTTLTTAIATVGAGETWRIYNLRIATSSANALVTLSILDTSAGTEKKIADAISVSPNSSLEIVDLIMEAGDVIKGGSTQPADIHIFGVVNT